MTETQISDLREAIGCFPPPQIARFLADVFFRYLQTSIYYVEEAWVYEFLDRFSHSSDDLDPEDLPSICTVLLVMACGTQFAHMESFQLTEQMAVDSATPPHFSEDDIGSQFHQASRKLMPHVLAMPSPRAVQACLMMATYNFSLDSAGTSYLYLSLALSMAVQQGLHREVGHDNTSVEAEVRRRIWWTVYTLHVQASIRYGRPKFLLDADISVKKPSDMPELRPLKEASCFRNQAGLIELILTTSRISSDISALRRTNKTIHFVNILSVRQRLIEWWDRLPEMSETDPRSLRNDIHLRLYYWNARVSLGRPFMLSAPSPEAEPQGAGPGRVPARQSLVEDSVRGALEVIRLCQMLRERVGLARASYVTEFTSCQTAMLILLARSLTNPSQEIRLALTRGLGIMKVMSVGNSLASFEARGIEVLERAVIRLERARTQGTAEAAGAPAHGTDNYDAFTSWSRLWKKSSGLTPPDSSSCAVNLPHPAQEERSQAWTVSDPLVLPDVGLPYSGYAPEDGMGAHFSMELSQFDLIAGFSPGLDAAGGSYVQQVEAELAPLGYDGLEGPCTY